LATTRVLIVDDEEDIRALLARLVSREGYEAVVARDGEQALQELAKSRPDIMLLDIKMPGIGGLAVLHEAQRLRPGMPVVMISSQGGAGDVRAALRAGASDYLIKPFDHGEVLRAVIRAGSVRQAASESAAGEALDDWFGASAAARRVRTAVGRVATSPFSVLISAAPGSGAAQIAAAVHAASDVRHGPFVVLDCATLGPGALTAERPGEADEGSGGWPVGSWRSASGGTLFIDEVSAMPTVGQARLARLIQDAGAGGCGVAHTDRFPRIIAATSGDPADAVQGGSLRRDLYFLLTDFVIHVPPLCERPDDVVSLAQRFAQAAAADLSKPAVGLSPAAVSDLVAYPWPGNVSELRSVIRRATALVDGGGSIEPAHLGLELLVPRTDGLTESGLGLRELVRRATRAAEYAALMHALTRAKGDETAAARLLRIDSRTIHAKLKTHGIALDTRPARSQGR